MCDVKNDINFFRIRSQNNLCVINEIILPIKFLMITDKIAERIWSPF